MLVLSPGVTLGQARGELCLVENWRIKNFLNIFKNDKIVSCTTFQFGEFSWTVKVHRAGIEGYPSYAKLSLHPEPLHKHPGSMLPLAPESDNSVSQAKSNLVRVSFNLCPTRTSAAQCPSYTCEHASIHFGADGLEMPLNFNENLFRKDYLDASGAVTLSLHLTAKADDMITHAAQHVEIQRQKLLGNLVGSLFSDKSLVSCTIVRCAASGRDFTVQNVILSVASPVFKAMLENEFVEGKEGLVTVVDYGEDVIEAALSFLYGATTSMPCDKMMQLYKFADQYSIEPLCSEVTRLIHFWHKAQKLRPNCMLTHSISTCSLKYIWVEPLLSASTLVSWVSTSARGLTRRFTPSTRRFCGQIRFGA